MDGPAVHGIDGLPHGLANTTWPMNTALQTKLDETFTEQSLPITNIDKTYLQLMTTSYQFWTVFTTAKNPMGENFLILNSFLAHAQCQNVHIQFTIHAKFIGDLKLCKFFHPHQVVSYLSHSISPYSIQQLTKETIAKLHQEAKASFMAHTSACKMSCGG